MSGYGQLNFDNRLEDRGVFTNSDLNPILRAALKKLQMPYGPRLEPKELYWDADFFGLSQLSLYQRLSASQQYEILWHCNRMALEEAFYIEKTGMSYAAKMALLADSNDKRALYNLFCADEAAHFHAIHSFLLAAPSDYREQAFLVMLDDLVHKGSFQVLVYMIQVILEGWGLHHYRSLAAHCKHSELTDVLRTIVLDEAKHHGSGLVVLPQGEWTSEDTAICLPALKEFLRLVKAGPLNLLNAIELVLGSLSHEDKASFLQDIGAEAIIARNEKILGGFIVEHCPSPEILQGLDAFLHSSILS